jgi:hypothetical protein
VAEVNDYDVKVASVDGEFAEHVHERPTSSSSCGLT